MPMSIERSVVRAAHGRARTNDYRGRHRVQRTIRTGRRIAAVITVFAMMAMTVSACSRDGRDGQSGATGPSATSSHGHGGPFVAPPAAPLRDGERFVNLTMPQRYAPSAPNGGTDEYRCFIVDPKLTATSFLTGSQFLPQNVDIVHHAIFFRVAPEDAAKARALDEETQGAGWRCFGDSGIDGDAAWVAHWAPGANEVLLREGLGYPMPAGSLLVMQVHYNLLSGRAGDTDQSGIRLRLADGSRSVTPLGTFLLPAPVELPCTAQESGRLCDRTAAVADVVHRFGDDAGQTVEELTGCFEGKPPAAGPTQRCDHTMEGAGTIYAVAGHMHLLGRSITVELNPGKATARTLLDIPVYNFDDQAIRPLSTPVTLKPGDVLRVTCTHDAGLRQQIPQLRQLPPRYVVWGDGTSDEMCLGILIGAQG
jgi:hypothetical protein